jgi:light-regulated signal transduction histidine kinase (bacteriophytochrome)
MRESHAQHCRQYFSRPRQRLMGGGSGATFAAQRKDGARLELQIGLSSIEWQGETFAIASILDVTQQRRAEREAQILTAQLIRSNEELNDFTYIVSHDLREPLRGIRSYAQFLVEDYGAQLDEDARLRFANLIRLTDRLDQLVMKLLEYSRHGRAELELENVDLNEVLEETLLDLSTSIRQSGAEIRVPRPLPAAVGDRSMLIELLANLIGNAVKYSDKQDKWVEIGFIAAPARGEKANQAIIPRLDLTDGSSGSSLGTQSGHSRAAKHDSGRNGADGMVYYMKDNGIGIPREHWGSVFRVFRRLHPRDAYGGGSGAGLTIAKKIVERHHGTIWLESTVGEGSTFFFTLGSGTPAPSGIQ